MENVGNEKNKKQNIMGYIALIFLVFLGVSIYRNPRIKLSWMMRFPPQKYNTGSCSFANPWGWDVSLGNKGERKVFFMSTGLFDYQDQYFKDCIPGIYVWYDKSVDIENPSKFLRIKQIIKEVVEEPEAIKDVRKINSIEYIFYRYQGNQLLCTDVDSKIPFVYKKISNNDSVVIAFYNEYGYYGSFWGLLPQEKDFWNVLSGIKIESM